MMDIFEFKEILKELPTNVQHYFHPTADLLGEMFDCDYVFISHYNKRSDKLTEKVVKASPDLPDLDFIAEILEPKKTSSSIERAYFLGPEDVMRIGLGTNVSVIVCPFRGAMILQGTIAIVKIAGDNWGIDDLEIIESIVSLLVRWSELTLNLIKNQHYVDTIFNSLQDAVFITSPEGIMLHYNDATERIFGYPAGWALGKHYSETVPYKERERTIKTIEHVVKFKKSIEFRFLEYTRLDNRIIYINPSYYPWLDEDGGLLGVIGIVSDETENKQYQDKLVETERMMTLGQTVAKVAHEIRSPLASIRGFARIMEKNEKPDSNEKKYAGEIVKQVDILNSMVQELLDFGKLDDEIEYNMLDINEVLRNAIKNSFIDKSKTKLIENFSENPTPIMGNKQNLEQAFVNLLNNACKTLKDERLIVITTISSHNNFTITIRNSGYGPKQLEDNISSELSLPIAQKLIENHGGKIKIINDVFTGTYFEITLPKNKYLLWRNNRESIAD